MNEISALASLSTVQRLLADFEKVHWWKDQMSCLRALSELTELALEPDGAPAGYDVNHTALRLRDERKHGVSYVHGSAKVQNGVEIIGDVIIGPNCEIGPNCVIFGPTILSSGSYIGPGAEIRRTIAGPRLKMPHQSYLGHSVVGSDVTLSAGFITAVRNLKRDSVHLKVGGELVDTEQVHFGAIIANGFTCPVGFTSLPGRLLSSPVYR